MTENDEISKNEARDKTGGDDELFSTDYDGKSPRV